MNREELDAIKKRLESRRQVIVEEEKTINHADLFNITKEEMKSIEKQVMVCYAAADAWTETADLMDLQRNTETYKAFLLGRLMAETDMKEKMVDFIKQRGA